MKNTLVVTIQGYEGPPLFPQLMSKDVKLNCCVIAKDRNNNQMIFKYILIQPEIQSKLIKRSNSVNITIKRHQ